MENTIAINTIRCCQKHRAHYHLCGSESFCGIHEAEELAIEALENANRLKKENAKLKNDIKHLETECKVYMSHIINSDSKCWACGVKHRAYQDGFEAATEELTTGIKLEHLEAFEGTVELRCDPDELLKVLGINTFRYEDHVHPVDWEHYK